MVTVDVPRATVPPSFRGRHPLTVQLGRYVVAGVVGTGVNALVYLSLRTGWDDAIAANLVALLVSTLVSTEVNRRFTFEGSSGPSWRAHVQTAGMVAFYAVYSSAVLLALAALVDNPSPLLESAVVSAASVLGGAGRFLLLRFWVFPEDDGTGARIVRVWRAHRRWFLRLAVAVSAGLAVLLATACVPFG